MVRTSLLLSEALHQRLIFVSQRTDVSVSALIRNLLDKALASREKRETRITYEVLKELDGIGTKGITNTSTTIDDLLYGKGEDNA